MIRAFYIPLLDSVDPRTLGKDAKTLLQEFLQSKKISLPTYNVVATHGAAHSQEFEIECLVPKLGIQVFGRGGSRRAGEQAAARWRWKWPSRRCRRARPPRARPSPRSAQLKLAGIATDQSDRARSTQAEASQRRPSSRTATAASHAATNTSRP